MKITPLDIQKKTFRTVWRGLDETEVDAFLEVVSGELEELSRENIALKEDLRRKNSRLEDYADREKVLQETMLTAQKITNDLKDQARKEAGLIIEDAERRAQRMVQDAHERLVGLIRDINELKRARTQFESGIRHLIESHINLLDTVSLGTNEPDTRPIEDNVAYLMPKAAGDSGEDGRD